MYPHYAPTSSLPHMPSPSSFSASLGLNPTAVRLSTASQQILEGDTVALGDERRKCALFIRNVDQRRLDASVVVYTIMVAGTRCARWRVDCWGFTRLRSFQRSADHTWRGGA